MKNFNSILPLRRETDDSRRDVFVADMLFLRLLLGRRTRLKGSSNGPDTVSLVPAAQVAAAAGAGIAESTISEVLAGKRKPNRGQIAKLARYFHVHPGTFLVSGLL
jgi:Helix-turn-helix